MTLSAVIVESGHKARRLDASESRPRSLDTVDEGRPVLDWILHALESVGVADPLYVGGYHIEKVLVRFPTLRVRYHERHAHEGELAALLCCEQISGPLMIINASTVLLPGACDLLRAKRLGRGVYGNGRPAGAYFVDRDEVHDSLVKARAIVKHDGAAGLEALFADMTNVETVPLDGLAAPIIDQEAVVRTIFRGKAQTLDHLAPVIRGAAHLPRERVTVAEWHTVPEIVLDHIARAFPDAILVVRSSASSEDTLARSAAGKYLSVLDILSCDRGALRSAIDAVVASYLADGRALDAKDEILIQPQLRNLTASGVLLTREPHSGAPYFVISEDGTSGRSDVVTGGGVGDLNQQYVAWSAVKTAQLSPHIRRLVDLGNELIELSCLDALDIEYAVDAHGAYYLLQARPLASVHSRSAVADEDVLELIEGVREFVNDRMRPLESLVGADTLYGVMPDWNPAEMIGIAPRPMALSLYQTLIGNESWAEARHRIGYRDVRPESLIVALGGRPYVDVRASLNSFLPATLEREFAQPWVDACLQKLREEPALHDKIEFKVAITCLAPDWDSVSHRVAEAGIDVNRFGEHLRRLTASMLSGSVEPIGRQAALLERMAERREQLLAFDNKGIHDAARTLGQLFDDCRRYGVVPFAILARYAFVSMSFLRGLLECGAITGGDYDAFLRAVPTVAGGIADDLRKGIPLRELVERYGHLRPNSYEITSPNYAADPDQFLCAPRGGATRATDDADDVLKPRFRAIADTLRRLGLPIEAPQLVTFMSCSIAERERAKFEFMKNINAGLELAATLGAKLGLDRDALSFLDIGDLLRLETHSLTQADKVQLRRRSSFNEKRWTATRAIRLPDVIRHANEILAFRLEAWRANFITRKRIVARAIWLDEAGHSPDLAGAIVVMRAADPGYDWIFAHDITGLITEYGGMGSHMSIRAAEFGLPAAIGCGGVVMESLRGATLVELDCAAERVRRLS